MIRTQTAVSRALKQCGLRDTIGDRYAAAWVTDGFARQGINYKQGGLVRGN